MDNTALDYYLNLIEAGVKDAEARTQVKALATALEVVATKENLQHLEAKINGKIEGIKGEIEGIKGEIGGIKGEIGGIKTTLNALIALNVSTLAFMLTMILNSVKHWW